MIYFGVIFYFNRASVASNCGMHTSVEEIDQEIRLPAKCVPLALRAL